VHPILFQLGFITIYAYGFFVALAFLVGVALSMWVLSRRGLYSDKLWDLALLIMILAIVGGRVFYVIEFFPQYLQNPLEMLMVWRGGLVFFGGLVFALAGTLAFLMLHKMPLWKILDAIVPGTILGYGIGRLGCFFNGCCYGCETNLSWAVHFPGTLGLRHPTQLYATGFALLAAGFFLWFLQRKKYDGQVFALGLLYYGGYRFLIEFLRVNPRYLLGLSEAQLIAMIIFAAALVLLFLLPRRNR